MQRASLSQGKAKAVPLWLLPGLAAAAALPPLGVIAMPGGLALFQAPRTGIVLATGMIAAPLLAAAVVGSRARRAPIAGAAEALLLQAFARVATVAAFILYVLGCTRVAGGAAAAAAPSLITGTLGLACAWLVLLQTSLSPARSAMRSRVVLVGDITLVSALLHAGGALAAPWFLLYPAIAVSAGSRSGSRALVAATALSTAGFAVAAWATPSWRAAPAMTAAAFAVIVLVPAQLGRWLHRRGRERQEAAAASTAKDRAFAASAEELRRSLTTILHAAASFDRGGLSPEQSDHLARLRLSTRAALMQSDDIPTLLAIEAGAFAPKRRGFDLYQLVHGAVAALRPRAAERGVSLSVRIDPRLPYELSGWPHQLRQLLVALVASGLRHSDRTAIAVTLDLVDLTGEGGRFSLVVRGHGTRLARALVAAPPEAGTACPELAVAERLVALMDGTIEVAIAPRTGVVLSVELPFSIDRAALALALDLTGLRVLIATGDETLARDLIEALETWRAVGTWIGTGEEALAQVAGLPSDRQRPAVIVDGRGEVLPALSWAHRAGRANPAAAPYLLFIADEARLDGVIGLADSELDAILPAPFTPGVLQSTLHALRVGTADWFPSEPLPVPALATPIAAEPTPVAAPFAVPIPALRPAAAPFRPTRRQELRVLVVAGNAANRKIIERILRTATHVPTLVADGEQAAETLATQTIDLVLVDLAGADAEAVELCLEASPDTPMIVLASDAEAIAGKATAVLVKPVEPRRLLAAIGDIYPPPPTGLPAEPVLPTPPADPDPVVTEISSHPRFARGNPAVIDERAVDALLSLGAGTAFFDDIVESFRSDTRELLKEIAGTAAIGDTRGFAGAIQALRNCTASFGGVRLREVLATLDQADAAELRRRGPVIAQQLGAELERLEATLVSYRQTSR